MMECVSCKQPILPDQKRASSVGIGSWYHDECWDDEDYSMDTNCSFCGGEAYQEPDDPLWEGFDDVPCKACNGTGLRRHQSVF